MRGGVALGGERRQRRRRGTQGSATRDSVDLSHLNSKACKRLIERRPRLEALEVRPSRPIGAQQLPTDRTWCPSRSSQSRGIAGAAVVRIFIHQRQSASGAPPHATAPQWQAPHLSIACSCL